MKRGIKKSKLKAGAKRRSAILVSGFGGAPVPFLAENISAPKQSRTLSFLGEIMSSFVKLNTIGKKRHEFFASKYEFFTIAATKQNSVILSPGNFEARKYEICPVKTYTDRDFEARR